MARRTKTPLLQDIQNYEDQLNRIQEDLAKVFTQEITEEMERMDISRADLALMLDLNRSQVSRLFNKPGNPTLRTLVGLASAVDYEVQIQLKPLKPQELPIHPNVVPPGQWLKWLSDVVVEPVETEWGLAGNHK